jgi:hypothetical protein
MDTIDFVKNLLTSEWKYEEQTNRGAFGEFNEES